MATPVKGTGGARKKELSLTVSAPPAYLSLSSSYPHLSPPDKRKFEAELARLTDEINAKKSKMVKLIS